jgi:hypothetical protein
MATASSSARSKIPTVLSELRSGIFGTAHNPSNARTGAKYLRRRLKGPSAVAYYPKTLRLATINAETPWNRFANWEGTWAVAQGAETQEGEEARPRIWAAQMNQLSADQVVPGPRWTEVERQPGAGWVHDEKERVRMEEVELKRAMGRGPPKKGTSTKTLVKAAKVKS